MKLNRREILRYLGYRVGQEADEGTEALIADTERELLQAIEPKCVYRVFPIREVTDGRVDFGFTIIQSASLARNLKDCTRAVFLAATLGSTLEYLFRKYNRLLVSRAVVLEAAAVEAIEEYCDACEQEILRELRAHDNGPFYLRPRFSPGYGDFPLEFQKEFLQIVEAPKKIGVTLTEGFLMTPSKSVTAIIGISRENTRCVRQGCENCTQTECAYRRS